jgi:hypothetical protein
MVSCEDCHEENGGQVIEFIPFGVLFAILGAVLALSLFFAFLH